MDICFGDRTVGSKKKNNTIVYSVAKKIKKNTLRRH